MIASRAEIRTPTVFSMSDMASPCVGETCGGVVVYCGLRWHRDGSDSSSAEGGDSSDSNFQRPCLIIEMADSQRFLPLSLLYLFRVTAIVRYFFRSSRWVFPSVHCTNIATNTIIIILYLQRTPRPRLPSLRTPRRLVLFQVQYGSLGLLMYLPDGDQVEYVLENGTKNPDFC